jgi:putative membrane protein insertion efficiency factor
MAVSPFTGGRAVCRFTPTCSEYAKQAIEKYGAFRGTIMGFGRILRCRPGGGYGYDPVP